MRRLFPAGVASTLLRILVLIPGIIERGQVYFLSMLGQYVPDIIWKVIRAVIRHGFSPELVEPPNGVYLQYSDLPRYEGNEDTFLPPRLFPLVIA